MNPVADIVRQLLIDKTLGVNSLEDDWSVFVGVRPDEPDAQILVSRGVGILEGRLHPTGEIVEQEAVQIVVEHPRYDIAEQKIIAITSTLDTNTLDEEITVIDAYGTGTTTYIIHALTRRSSILGLGVDQNRRSRYSFSVNYTLSF
jgi:hypothetical protein